LIRTTKLENKKTEENIAYQISFPFGQPLDMLGRYMLARSKKEKKESIKGFDF